MIFRFHVEHFENKRKTLVDQIHSANSVSEYLQAQHALVDG